MHAGKRRSIVCCEVLRWRAEFKCALGAFCSSPAVIIQRISVTGQIASFSTWQLNKSLECSLLRNNRHTAWLMCAKTISIDHIMSATDNYGVVRRCLLVFKAKQRFYYLRRASASISLYFVCCNVSFSLNIKIYLPTSRYLTTVFFNWKSRWLFTR